MRVTTTAVIDDAKKSTKIKFVNISLLIDVVLTNTT